MALEIDLRDERVEAQLDVIVGEPRRVMDLRLIRRSLALAELRLEKLRAVIRQRRLVSGEDDGPLFVMLANPLANTGAANPRTDNKVVSTNHFGR